MAPDPEIRQVEQEQAAAVRFARDDQLVADHREIMRSFVRRDVHDSYDSPVFGIYDDNLVAAVAMSVVNAVSIRNRHIKQLALGVEHQHVRLGWGGNGRDSLARGHVDRGDGVRASWFALTMVLLASMAKR